MKDAHVLHGILLADEPAIGVTTFAENGEVLLTLTLTGELSQAIIGLTPVQAIELHEKLGANLHHCRAAVGAGMTGPTKSG